MDDAAAAPAGTECIVLPTARADRGGPDASPVADNERLRSPCAGQSYGAGVARSPPMTCAI
jgi:hypothetical protein